MNDAKSRSAKPAAALRASVHSGMIAEGRHTDEDCIELTPEQSI